MSEFGNEFGKRLTDFLQKWLAKFEFVVVLSGFLHLLTQLKFNKILAKSYFVM